MNAIALRRTTGLVIIGLMALLLAVAIPASASESTVTGDCDGWTVHLDGTWGAYWVTVDGVTVFGSPGGPGHDGQGDPINWFVADTSDATSRTFEVVWRHHTNGITTHNSTGTRSVDGCNPPDTTVPEDTTTTTVADTTTTTAPEDTTTTTAADTTTTTAPEDTTTTTTQPQATTTTTLASTTTTAPQVEATTTVPDTLPFTGVESEHLAVMAVVALALGSGLVLLTRQNAESDTNQVI